MAACSCSRETVCGAAGSCARTAPAAQTHRTTSVPMTALIPGLPSDRFLVLVLVLVLVELQRQLQVGGFVSRELHRVAARVARAAVRRALVADRRQQSLEA